MKINSNNLKKVNIKHIVLHALLIPHNRQDLEKKVETAVQDTVKIVTAMLSRNMDSSVIRVNDAIKMIGGDTRKIRKRIDEAIRLGSDEFTYDDDGVVQMSDACVVLREPIKLFEKPPIIPVDNFIYIVVILCLQALSANIEDLDEAIVMNELSSFIDIGTVKSEYDMSCYCFLIDYFIECLRSDDDNSFMFYLQEYKSPYVTTKRMKSFLRGSYDEKTKLDALLIKCSNPSSAIIANSILRCLKIERDNILSEIENGSYSEAFAEEE